jgi:chemotaxis protein MotA
VDLATVGGIVLAFGAVGLSVMVEGGSLGALYNTSAAILVFGGSLGAAVVAQPLADTLRIPLVLKQALFAKGEDPIGIITLLTNLARVARREGVLALEGEVLNIQDLFIRRGVQLIVDGTDAEVTQSILETELEAQQDRHGAGARFFTAMGGLLPTLGVTGTVMGLVNMLGKLDDPGGMGPAIAAAFIATLYGVATANLIFLPVAGKLKARSDAEAFARRMVIVGVRGIQAGDSPIVLAERLKAFLTHKQRAEADRRAAAGGDG